MEKIKKEIEISVEDWHYILSKAESFEEFFELMITQCRILDTWKKIKDEK